MTVGTIQVANVLAQSQLNSGVLSYQISNVSVSMAEQADTAGMFTSSGGGDTSDAISVQTDQIVKVTFKWDQSGQFANITLPVEFHCKVLLEHMGKAGVGPNAADDTNFEETVSFQSGNPFSYLQDVDITGMAAGLYRVFAVFTLELTNTPNLLGTGEAGNTPVAGFIDLGVINFFKAN